MDDFHRYEFGLAMRDGTFLGRVPINPDWEPAEAAVRFLALRKGKRSNADARARVEPKWSDEHGPPFVRGFQVHLPVTSGHVSSELSVDYFLQAARAAFRLVRGDDHDNGVGSFRFVVLAIPKPEVPEPETSPTQTVERVDTFEKIPEAAIPWEQFEVSREPSKSAQDYPVFVEASVLQEIRVHVLADPERETGGILLGSLFRDPKDGEIFGVVNEGIRAPHTEADAVRLRFTPETWASLRAAGAERGPDSRWMGWYHSHPDVQDDFFSGHDLVLHRTVFPGAHQIALVASLESGYEPRFALYGWRRGIVTARQFTVLDDKHQDRHRPQAVGSEEPR